MIFVSGVVILLSSEVGISYNYVTSYVFARFAGKVRHCH